MTNLEIVNAYVGTDQVEKIYLGADVIYSGGTGPVEDPMLRTPLTIEITDSGSTSPAFGIRLTGVTSTTQRDEYRRPVEYVLTRNGVETTGYFELNSAVSSSAVTSTISVQIGDKIELYAKNANQGGFSSANTIFQYFVCTSDLKANVYGNVNSLLVTKTEFDTNGAESLVLSAYTFCKMFLDKEGFSFGAPADYYHILLPSTTLAANCYQYMFGCCTSLTTAPQLPATTLAQSCYNGMFSGCTSLTTPPSILPATTLASYCYGNMFSGCTSLTTAPELPATTLASYCYQYMFYGCTSLTEAPELPATTLANYCYYNMFRGCTSLTTAPELPATNFGSQSGGYYLNMFSGCSRLNYVKCMVLNPNSNTTAQRNPTYGWLSSVASSGTFVRPAGVTTWASGPNGIPSGWTVVDA